MELIAVAVPAPHLFTCWSATDCLAGIIDAPEVSPSRRCCVLASLQGGLVRAQARRELAVLGGRPRRSPRFAHMLDPVGHRS